nr:MAG TPA: hypothetical protein [Bacteriophage sp.]
MRDRKIAVNSSYHTHSSPLNGTPILISSSPVIGVACDEF